MKLTFLQSTSLLHLGIMHVSAVLKKHGHSCDLLLQSLEKDMVAALLRSSPDAVGFSLTTGEHKWALDMARRIKEKLDIPIIFGGPHPTFYPEMIENENVDIICRGEGEYAALELMNNLEEGKDIKRIKNLWVKDSGKIFRNDLRPLISNLDELPFPDRELFYKYRFLRNFSIKNFITGRGCPYSCTFCFNHSYRKMYRVSNDEYVRRRSVHNVIKEIKEVISRYGAKKISFSDDTFIFNQRWLNEFLEEYKREVALPFTCNIRANLVNEQIIKKMKSAGCFAVAMGIESGNKYIRNEILRKKITDEQIKRVAYLVKKYRIRLKTFNMMGLPTETLEDAFETIKLNAEIRPDYANCGLFVPYPGLQLTQYAIKNNYLKESFSLDDLSRTRFTRSSPLNLKDRKELENLNSVMFLAVKYPSMISLIKKMIKFRLYSKKLFQILGALIYGYYTTRLYELGMKEAVEIALRSRFIEV